MNLYKLTVHTVYHFKRKKGSLDDYTCSECNTNYSRKQYLLEDHKGIKIIFVVKDMRKKK